MACDECERTRLGWIASHNGDQPAYIRALDDYRAHRATHRGDV